MKRSGARSAWSTCRYVFADATTRPLTTDENRRHWANADLLSADAANNPRVRSILRSRARYEVANNSYAKGIVSTLANDCIGTGPRLQMLTDEAEANRVVEQEFMRWADSVSLAEKLRTMRMARSESGEVFAMLVANPRVDSPVKLDLRLIEADQVTTPDLIGAVQRHQCRRRDRLRRLRQSGRVPRAEKPSGRQHRPILARLRPCSGLIDHPLLPRRSAGTEPRHSRDHASLAAVCPVAALHAGGVGGGRNGGRLRGRALYTDAPANGEADPVEPMDLVELERRMATVLPGGWRLGQVQAEQPSTTYGEFKRELLNEIARCLSIPYNVAACNSSGYNYASGRLDHQTYYKSIRVDQAQLGLTVLDRVLRSVARRGDPH